MEALEDRLLLAAVPATMTSAEAESMAFFERNGNVYNTLQMEALLTGTSDVDSWVFAGLPGWHGTYSFRIESLPGIRASIGIYDGDTGAAVRTVTIGPSTVAAFVQPSMAGGKEYVLALADLNGSTWGNLNVRIDAPGTSAIAWQITPDANGDGAHTTPTILDNETDFYRFTAPADTNGQLRVTVDPDTTSLAPAVMVTGPATTIVGQAYTATAGATVTADMTGLIPGLTYYAAVAGQKHATSGDYDIHVDFGVAPVVTALTCSPKAVFSGGAIALAATGVSDADGDLLGVQFHRDANGNEVLDAGDTFLSADVSGADGWTAATSAAGLADGRHTFFARAIDSANSYSPVVSDWVYHNPVPGDANLDGKVNVYDLAVLANNYAFSGKGWTDADFTGEGTVNVFDLALLANNYGHGTGGGLTGPTFPSHSTPESMTVDLVSSAPTVAAAPTIPSLPLPAVEVAPPDGPARDAAALAASPTAPAAAGHGIDLLAGPELAPLPPALR